MFVFLPVSPADSISVTWIGMGCLSPLTGRSKRLFLRVNHAASHPKCVEAPPQPAADRPDSCNDQIAAVHRDGVFVEESGPAQDRKQVVGQPIWFSWRRLCEEIAGPIVLAPGDDNVH